MIGIISLKERRLRGDMIEVYKLLTGKEQIDHRQFFESTLQTHHMASEDTKRNWQKTDRDWIQGNSSLVKEWSMDGAILPTKVVNSESVNSLKNAYDRYYCKGMDNRS